MDESSTSNLREVGFKLKILFIDLPKVSGCARSRNTCQVPDYIYLELFRTFSCVLKQPTVNLMRGN
jgi:hypothetical protein